MASIAERDAALSRLGMVPNSALAEGSPFTDEESNIFERVKKEVGDDIVNSFSDAWQDRLIRGLWTHNKGTEEKRFEEAVEAFRTISEWRKKNEQLLQTELVGFNEVMQHIRMIAGGDDLYGHVVWVEQLDGVAELCSTSLTTEQIVSVRAQATEAMEALKVKLSQELGVTRYKQVYVLDLAPLALGPLISRSDVRHLTKDIMGLGSQYYPEGMWKIFIINAPFIFRTVYGMMSPFINPVTKEKIKIIGSKYLKEMEKNGIPIDSVPKIIGGRHPGTFMHTEILKRLNEVHAARGEPPIVDEVELPAEIVDNALSDDEQPGAAQTKKKKKRGVFSCCSSADAVHDPSGKTLSREPPRASSYSRSRSVHDDERESEEEEKVSLDSTNVEGDSTSAAESQAVVHSSFARRISQKAKLAIATSLAMFAAWFVYF